MSKPGYVIGCAVFIGGLVVLPMQRVAPVMAADAPPAATCEAYGTNTELSDQLIVPGMLPPCAPAVQEGGAFTDIVDNLQHGFDLYSWLTFAALTSPADGKTALGAGSRPNGDAPAIWESYKQLPDLMDADPPPQFDDPVKLPKECGSGAVTPGTMVIHIAEETFNQPFKTGPLIDQNGNYALFVILMNREMYEFIVNTDLNTRAGQRRFKDKEIAFPSGDNQTVKIGAVMIKASWKVLGTGDDPAKFHTITGLVFTPGVKGRDGTCVKRTLGLIGFHVGHKTRFNPQWVWTTFEHVRNVPDEADTSDRKKLSGRFNFFNADCDIGQCPFNQTPKGRWDPAVQPFPGGFRSQIVRVIPVTTDAAAINAKSQAVGKVKESVWANYMLVSTQWPTDRANQIDKSGVPAPTFLANTTLETYSQGRDPQASSSCIGCHLNATTARAGDSDEQVKSSDFTYILEKAH